MSPSRSRRYLTGLWYLLLLLPYIATLWVPFYNRVTPSFGGMPFFYWYQLLWVGITALLTAIVYWATEARSQRKVPSDAPDGQP